MSIFEGAIVLSPEEIGPIYKKDPGPFSEGQRVCCPLKMFARRKTSHCESCEYFNGIARKHVIGTFKDELTSVGLLYTIVCSHPVSRGIAFFPED